MKTDLQLGRNKRHQYTLDSRPPIKVKRDGTPYANQPRPKHTLPGVTTIVNQLDKPGLHWAAAKLTAETAVHAPHRWAHLAGDTAVDLLRREPDRVWRVSAAIGSVVHDAALAFSLGEDFDAEDALEASDAHLFDEEREPAVAKINGHIDALERFYDDEQPEWETVEQAVVNAEHGYGGCYDAVGTFRSLGRALIDFKTGKRYDESTTLQLAGYRLATPAEFDDDGWFVETLNHEMPNVCAGVWLREDGTYEFDVLPVNEHSEQQFVHLLHIYKWRKEMTK